MEKSDLGLNKENTEHFIKYLNALDAFISSDPILVPKINGFHRSVGVCGNSICVGLHKEILFYFCMYMKDNDIALISDNHTMSVEPKGVQKALKLGISKKMIYGKGVVIGDDYFFADNKSRIPFVTFIIDKYGFKE